MKKLLIISAIMLAQNVSAEREMALEQKQRTDGQNGGMRITGYRTTKGVADDLNGTYQMPTIAMGTSGNNNEEENIEEEDMTAEPESKHSTANSINWSNDNNNDQAYDSQASEYASYDIE